jgi:hypothetical protein
VASIAALNGALVKALGFGDLKGVTGLVLQLSADKPPVVTVQRVIFQDHGKVVDEVSTVVDRFELKPVAAALEAPANVFATGD